MVHVQFLFLQFIYDRKAKPEVEASVFPRTAGLILMLKSYSK